MANDPLIDSDAFRPGESAENVADALTLVHESRSERSQQLDEQKDAKLTADPDLWSENPSEYDFPGVDTGPKFREENPNFELVSFIDTFR